MLSRYRAIDRRGVLGLNARNRDYVMRYNPRRFYPKVDNKRITKEIMIANKMAVPELYGLVRTEHDAGELEDTLKDRSEFVIKPAAGSGGDGILLIGGRSAGQFRKPSGVIVTKEDMRHHVSNILNGMYSLGGLADEAMLEALVHSDPVLDEFTYLGVPDVRVIVFLGVPVMAMMRLPTRMSDGKANLHQGAIGVGIGIGDGTTRRAVQRNMVVDEHPDTGRNISGFKLPVWDQFLDYSARGYEATGLGYIGVDIVLDAEKGPLVLELNARPGLNIQIANQAGLRARLEEVEALGDREWTPAERIAWARDRW